MLDPNSKVVVVHSMFGGGMEQYSIERALFRKEGCRVIFSSV